jgi:hypothetical protein
MSRHTFLNSRCSIFLSVAALLISAASSACGQDGASLPSADTTFVIIHPARDSVFQLSHQFIAASSDTVVLDSGRVLVRSREYVVDYRYGRLRLDSSVTAAFTRDTSSLHHRLTVRYQFFPFHFQDTYAHHVLVALPDSAGKDSVRIARPKQSFSIDDIFGPNLQKSGSITRGFTVGSNRDLSLNSGFRMQLAGKLASDIDIAAALTDENTPIQPEGTTQTLQEFDKVFVEIRSTAMAATLGDFVLDLNGPEFGSLSRKLQGAEGTGQFRSGAVSESVLVAGAVTRGKFTTLQFTGLEAVQGPYRLTGRNGERAIIVIAGTERVYINGELQSRGETNDYTIDYSLAEVTFTPHRLITSASRIVIDFEYTDRQYSRSLFAAQSGTGLFDNKARVTLTFAREADDPDAPIDFAVTDSARLVLQQAGGDRNKAVQSGVTQVDSGGTYALVDTVLANGQATQYFRYAPGDPGAKYQLTFSFVGTGLGEYVRQQVGVFIWQGPGGGDYMPIRYLPLPQLQQIVDVALEASPVKELKVSGEFARSEFNANRFSTLPGVITSGDALKFSASYSPRDVRIGGLSIGGFDLAINERKVASAFTPIDRTNVIEFTRKWGVDTLTAGDEEIREGTFSYLPAAGFVLGGEYGRITRGDDLSSTRTAGNLALKAEHLPTVGYMIERVHATENSSDNASIWLRQKGSAAYTIGIFTPGFAYEGERRTITSIGGTTFKDGTFSYDEFGPRLLIKNLGPVTLSGELVWRYDNLVNDGALLRESNAVTQTYSGNLAGTGAFTTSLDVTLREKQFTPVFKQLGNSDLQTVLVKSQSRYAPQNRGVEADLFYQVETQRSSKLERVFVRVPDGTGTYQYLGDLNGNGLADDAEFVPSRFDADFIAVTVPTDALYPVIDLNTSARLRLRPVRIFGTGNGFLERILKPLSTETYVRLEEKSTERDLKQIYLLNFKRFLQDSTTVNGTQLFTQDFLLFDGDPLFSSRLRYSQGRGLANYAGGIERSYTRERSLRLRWQLVPEVSNQLDLVNKTDRLQSQEASGRVRDILSNSLTFDVSYRPEQNIELGFKIDLGDAKDRYQSPVLDAALNAQAVRAVYAFQGAGQLRGELSREEIQLSRATESFPYELTGGRVAGKTWIWRVGFDYRMTQFIQATVNYDGRTEGGGTPIHTARAEVRAFF